MKTMSDVREYMRERHRLGTVESIAPDLAKDFQRRMAENLIERELVGIDYLNSFVYDSDSGVCGSHDYLDANMVMLDAVADFCERVVGIPRDVFLEEALSEEEVADADGAVLTLFRVGWDEAKKLGFSETWNELSDPDLRKDLGLLLLKIPVNAASNHPLEDEISAEFEGAYERVVGGNDDLKKLAYALGDGDDSPVAVRGFVEAVVSSRSSVLTL
jgi:hypothetical protein